MTPMAAVAGGVADEVLEALVCGRRLDKAFVNNGGDIAFYLTEGQSLTAGLVADYHLPNIDGECVLTRDMPVRGIATSGWKGRSFSLGIADSVTVLAKEAREGGCCRNIDCERREHGPPGDRTLPGIGSRSG